jgi:hypothetical protein
MWLYWSKESPLHEWSNAMSDIMEEQVEDEILEIQISDEALEAAASAGNSGCYTEWAYCTHVACPVVS